jgi:stress response protein SCP2
MNSSIQQILIRRKSKVHFEATSISTVQIANTGVLGAIIANFGSLGYVIDNTLLEELQFGTNGNLVSFYKEVFPMLQKQVGANNVHFRPMYPNFPDQVANASDEELYVNAILHYFGDVIGQRIIPKYEEEIRFPFCEETEPMFIGLASDEEVNQMFTQIFESKTSPSMQDKEDINIFFGSVIKTVTFNIPVFTNKEKMAYVLALLLKKEYWNWFGIWATGNIKTATDVLRLAVAYSGGDESLTKVSKFGKFPRPVRRLLLCYLNEMNQSSVMEDMKRFEGMWIRLGEKLHPGEFKKYTNIGDSFHSLRNDLIITTNSKIEKLLASSDWQNLIAILKTRPGDFARRMNAILSKTSNKFVVMDAFKSIADKVSTPVLWQLHGYFSGRDKLCEFRNRMFIPKTPVALVTENNLVSMGKGYQVGMVQIIEDALIKTYFNLHCDLGKVWIDPICKNLLIPSGNRSASTALRQVARGSRFQLGKDKSTVRLFVYWKDVDGKDSYNNRVDLDLSAIMYDKNFKSLGQCSWTNLRYGSGKDDASMIHSGDITSAPEGAAEFLDINIDKLHKDVAYIVCNVFNFTGQKMNQLDVGFCGWMEREHAGSGEIFEPKSVTGRCDLTADATSTCPMILDVVNREIIWADLSITLSGGCQSTERTMDKSTATAELVSRMSATKASLYDLFLLHTVARDGELVINREDANFVIAEDGDLSPYDIAKVTSEWL